MLVVRQSESSSNSLPTVKFIQIRPGAGWYEDGTLVTSYAANGSSNVWTWTVPTKAVLTFSGCGGGAGGGAGYNDGASAGAGGGGGGAGLGLQNITVVVPAGEVLKLTVGAAGAGGIAGGAAGTNGGDTKIEFTSLLPGECDTRSGGTIGNAAQFILWGGVHGNNATSGATGHGYGGDAGGSITVGATDNGYHGSNALTAEPPYFRQSASGCAGGDPGTAGGSQITDVGHSNRTGSGGAVANGAGGGGCGGISIFGFAGAGGAGQANGATMTLGYGSGGGGGGGNAAGSSNAGNGAAGRPGYLEIIYQVVQ